jgi:hypothetical protein
MVIEINGNSVSFETDDYRRGHVVDVEDSPG